MVMASGSIGGLLCFDHLVGTVVNASMMGITKPYHVERFPVILVMTLRLFVTANDTWTLFNSPGTHSLV